MRIGPRGAFLLATMPSLVVLVGIASWSTSGTNGQFTYVLDDAYIHMAVAKNLLEHGVWGVTSAGFASVSSSILWVLLLTASGLVPGTRDLAPLGLNLVAAVITLALLERALRRACRSEVLRGVLVLALFFLAGIPALVFTGLEHVAHVAASLFCLDRARRALCEPSSRARDAWLLVVAAALVTSLRYEGLFLVAVVAGLLLLRRRRMLAAATTASALLPIAVLGVVARGQGWHFLPNSILLKSNKPSLQPAAVLDWLLSSYRNLVDAPVLAFLLAFCLVVFLLRLGRRSSWESGQIQLVIVAATTFLHMQFSSLSWFMRYEAYLFASSLVVLASTAAEALAALPRADVPGFRSAWLQRGALALLVLFPLLPLANRAMLSLRSIAPSACNIFEQQVQMGLFCRRFYAGETVGANDIGAICYLADVRCFDIWGLASLEVCDAKLRASLGGDTSGLDLGQLDRLLRQSDVQVLVVYERVLNDYGDPARDLPWIRVGSWRITNNVVCAEDRVTFYAPDAARAAELQEHLASFRTDLPASVIQEGASWERLEFAPEASP